VILVWQHRDGETGRLLDKAPDCSLEADTLR